jgi:Family of unknown function (DUF6941)
MVLCDFAQVAEGKLYITGGGWTHALMAGPLNLSLGVLITVPWDRTNEQHTLRAVLVDDDGNEQEIDGRPVAAEGQFEVGRPAGVKRGSALNAPVALTFTGLQLEPGGYVWELYLDGEPRARTPFHVVQQGQAPKQ